MADSGDSQDIDTSGSGDYKAGDLENEEVRIEVGGSGSALVNVSDELELKVRSSGSVKYIGDPNAQQGRKWSRRGEGSLVGRQVGFQDPL